MESFGTIEAVKAVSEMFSPLSGVINDTNKSLEKDSTVINRDPYGAGWIIKIAKFDPAEVNALLDAASYRKLLEE
jgi:glycine cleavage system H protein